MTETNHLDLGRIAVTGGAGFIGSHLAERLVPAHDVVVFDDLSTGDRENVPDAVTFHETDVREIGPADLEDVDVVFHQAANVSVSRSMEEPLFDADVNVIGLLSALQAARQAGVSRFVSASSAAVYGEPDVLPVSEDYGTDPQSPYAAGKCSGEAYCRAFDSMTDIDTVCLRYFNVYGPRQRADSPYSGVVPVFVDRLLDGESLPIHGDGTQSRDFIHVDDIVEANLLAATVDEVDGNVYNVGTGDRVSVNDLADELESIVGTSPGRIHEDRRPGDVDHSQADIGKIRAELGFNPSTGLEAGLADVIEWYRSIDDGAVGTGYDPA